MAQSTRGGWIAVGWLACAALAQAATYKWVDENGVTQYSQFPPPDRKAETLAPPPPPADDPEASQGALDDLLKRQDEQRKQRSAAEDERNKALAQAAERDTKCRNARKALEALTTGGRKRFYGPDGEATYLTDEDREARIAKAREHIDAYCGN